MTLQLVKCFQPKNRFNSVQPGDTGDFFRIMLGFVLPVRSTCMDLQLLSIPQSPFLPFRSMRFTLLLEDYQTSN